VARWKIVSLASLLGTLAYFSWNPATELLYVGDGKYEVDGIPPFTNHRVNFGEIDVSRAGAYQFSFRGFAPHDRPILYIHIKQPDKSVLVTSEVCFRATIYKMPSLKSGRKKQVRSGSECLSEAASRNADEYIRKHGQTVFLISGESELSRFRGYQLVLEVTGDDHRLADEAPTLEFISGWK